MALQDLTDALDGFGLSDQEHLLFSPTEEKLWLQEKFHDIPRYLFRISTPKSDGTTNEVWVKSKDATHDRDDSRVDILSRYDDQEIAGMLNRHLRWWGNEKSSDNLVSWTSSLLFALQYISYRRSDSRDGSSLDQISFCVIDTTRFPEGVFLRDLDLIRAYCSLDKELQYFEDLRTKARGGAFYFGEYLTQGALKIEDKCQIVSAQAIVDQELYSLRLDWRESGLADAVVHHREAFSQETPEVTEAELKIAVSISMLFESGWRLPIAASFIALLPRRKTDVAILQMFRVAPFRDIERAQCSPSSTKVMVYKNLPEVEQFDVILRSVYNDFCLKKLKARINAAEVALRTAIDTVTSKQDLDVENLITGYEDLTLIGPYHEDILLRLDTVISFSQYLQQNIPIE